LQEATTYDTPPNPEAAAPANDLVEKYRTQIEGRPVLLFDGVCVFCNRTVQFLLRHDRRSALRFVPQESPLGQQLLAPFDEQSCPEGVILITDALTPSASVARRTGAFSVALILIGGIWRYLGKLIRALPHPLREFAYDLIARNRYRIFGKYQTCPIPAPDQRSRILGLSSRGRSL
jgi:predicted DCC family thiol-disulfide oxidoreductase YuxK